MEYSVCKKHSVVQMLNGKAYSMAVRALYIYLVEEAIIVFLKTNEASETVDKDELKALYSQFAIICLPVHRLKKSRSPGL